MRTILVGYDGTAPAERALRRAAELAHALGAGIAVVSVAAPRPLDEFDAPGAFGLFPYDSALRDPGAYAARDEELWERHRERVQAYLSEAGVPFEFHGVGGDPADELVAAAEHQHAELIVVGTREPGVLDRLLGGSVSQGVARRAHCDVLIVHPTD